MSLFFLQSKIPLGFHNWKNSSHKKKLSSRLPLEKSSMLVILAAARRKPLDKFCAPLFSSHRSFYPYSVHYSENCVSLGVCRLARCPSPHINDLRSCLSSTRTMSNLKLCGLERSYRASSASACSLCHECKSPPPVLGV